MGKEAPVGITSSVPSEITVGTETQRGYNDQHGGGMAFAHDETIMNWLFNTNT